MSGAAPADGTGPYRPGPAEFGLLLFLGCTWGSSYLFTELALQTITPFTLAAGRIVTGALFLVPTALLLGHRLLQSWRTLGAVALVGLTGHAAPFLLLTNGQDRIDSGTTAIIISSVPILTLFLAHFTVRDDRITWRKAVGVGIGFAGIVLLIGPGALAGLTEHFWGQLMVFGTAFNFALTTVISRFVRDIPPLVMAAGSLIFASLYLTPLAFALEAPLSLEPSLISLSAMVAMGVLATGLAVLAFFRLAKTAPPNFLAMNNYITPVVGVMWSVVLLREGLPPMAFAALGLIFAGIAVTTGAGLPRRKRGAA